jgi:hypothetical protein
MRLLLSVLKPRGLRILQCPNSRNGNVSRFQRPIAQFSPFISMNFYEVVNFEHSVGDRT